ncbi:MAG: HAD family hydrolase [Enterocloster clostridioformis]
MEGVFGKGYFNLVYGEREDKGIRKKPCPDGVWAIAEELGLSKSEILYLGDTNTDMEAGDNAKVDTVGVTWDFGPGRAYGLSSARLLRTIRPGLFSI